MLLPMHKFRSTPVPSKCDLNISLPPNEQQMKRALSLLIHFVKVDKTP